MSKYKREWAVDASEAERLQVLGLRRQERALPGDVVCLPIYEIWDEKYSDSYIEVYAASPGQAAECYTAQLDEWEPCLYDGGGTTHEFMVRKQGDTEWCKWSGWVEATSHYRASPVAQE